MFNYFSEMFPTKIRGLTSGILVFSGRFSNTLAPTLEFIAERSNVHPLVIGSIPCVFGLIASFVLPETLNKSLIT